MATTIQIQDNVKKMLDSIKVFKKETYNETIEWILEDYKKLNAKTLKEFDKRINSKDFISHEEVMKRFN